MQASKIHIGFCENGAGFGGAIISLAAFLEKIPEKFKPYIYTSLATADYQQIGKLGDWRHLPAVTLLNYTWLKEKGIPFVSSIDNLCNVAPYAMRFAREFKRDRIKIVYLNNDPSCNLAAALAARYIGIPLILHARGSSADTKGTRWVLSNIDHCIAVSNAIKAQLIELGLASEKCTVVPEGLDMNLFYPRPPSLTLRNELGINDTAPVLTLVGGLIDWKGQDVLLDASPLIFKQFPNAHILLVGSAYGKSDSYANEIIKRATAAEFGGRVHMLGSRKDIPEILSISTIVLHTSTKPEPFGRTFLEGMAMGKPVIASNEGGPTEVIDNEVDGLLIPPRDPQRLASSIGRLLLDPNFAQTLGRNAAIKAAKYSIENHVDGIQAVLKNVITEMG